MSSLHKHIGKLKLYYFDIPGKGEAIRLVCNYANIPLEDIRLDRDEFTKLKDEGKLAFGQVPCLEIENRNGSTGSIVQSAAIMRYLGKIVGGSLYPADPLQAAYIDSIIDQEIDLFMGLSVSLYKSRFGFSILDDADLLATVRTSLNDEVLPRHLTNFEKFMASSATGWIAGGEEPSIADFILVPRLIWLIKAPKDGITSSILKPFPLLNKLIERFLALPSNISYYQNHMPLV